MCCQVNNVERPRRKRSTTIGAMYSGTIDVVPEIDVVTGELSIEHWQIIGRRVHAQVNNPSKTFSLEQINVRQSASDLFQVNRGCNVKTAGTAKLLAWIKKYNWYETHIIKINLPKKKENM